MDIFLSRCRSSLDVKDHVSDHNHQWRLRQHSWTCKNFESSEVFLSRASKEAAQNREAEIKLAALHPRVAEVLRLTDLELLFDIRNSESEVLAAFLTKERSATMGLAGAAETN